MKKLFAIFGMSLFAALLCIPLGTVQAEDKTFAGSPYFCESSFWASKPKFAAKA